MLAEPLSAPAVVVDAEESSIAELRSRLNIMLKYRRSCVVSMSLLAFGGFLKAWGIPSRHHGCFNTSRHAHPWMIQGETHTDFGEKGAQPHGQTPDASSLGSDRSQSPALCFFLCCPSAKILTKGWCPIGQLIISFI
jgi:hypothetical protein